MQVGAWERRRESQSGRNASYLLERGYSKVYSFAKSVYKKGELFLGDGVRRRNEHVVTCHAVDLRRASRAKRRGVKRREREGPNVSSRSSVIENIVDLQFLRQGRAQGPSRGTLTVERASQRFEAEGKGRRASGETRTATCSVRENDAGNGFLVERSLTSSIAQNSPLPRISPRFG